MTEFLATGPAVLMDTLALFGMAFVLSRGFGLLRSRPERQRTVILSIAFAAMAVGSMMASVSIGPGSVGDIRNAIVAVAAIVGGPVSALAAAAAAATYRVYLGGSFATPVAGIAAAAALSIGFMRTKLPKTPVNLALFGIVLAAALTLLLQVASLFSPLSTQQAARLGMTGFVLAVVIYPIALVVIAGLLKSEQRKADDQAELKTVNAALSLQAARTQGVFESSGVAMAWVDLRNGRFVLVNPQYAKFTGYSEAELIGMRFDELAVPEDRENDFAVIKPLQTGETTTLNDEKRYLRKDGAIAWGMRSVTVVREGGELRYAFALVHDITERKRAREEIAYLASRDSMTGLVNRLVFHSELAEAIARRRPDEIVTLLFLDFDDFKVINDTLGHPTGDAILIELARRLSGAVAKDDIVARFGGDEFAILRKGEVTREEIGALAELLTNRVTAPVAAGSGGVTLVLSIGISLWPRDGLDADELIKRADIALYAAKGSGENGSTFRFFEPEMEEQLVARQELKLDLTVALSNNELEIEYQPIVDLHTGQVSSFEALLRWRHPRRGMISRSEFIPLAEETGLIGPIGDWVLNKACREATNWPTSVGVAVNVSPVQLRNRLLALRVAEVLSKSGLNPGRLELEITETVLLQGSEDHLRSLHDLRHLGVKVALDDFCTGYSTLGYLQLFPFDRIKIDRSFVIEVTQQQESRAVIRALVELGHSLNMRITAEGVETQEQLDRVSAKGCDEAQGFLISKPVPPNEVQALIARLATHAALGVGAA